MSVGSGRTMPPKNLRVNLVKRRKGEWGEREGDGWEGRTVKVKVRMEERGGGRRWRGRGEEEKNERMEDEKRGKNCEGGEECESEGGGEVVCY